jgi:HEAT repeat protein
VTARADSPVALESAQVAELINTLAKALRTFQMYPPNNPIHQRAVQGVRAAFEPIWAAADDLVLSIGEAEFRWEDEVVYQQANRSESLAWLLFKDGMRVLVIRRGADAEEVPRFLVMMNRVRFLPADAADDLMTLLWEQDFQYIQYQFIDFLGEGESLDGPMQAAAGGAGETSPTAAAERQAQVQEEAPPRPKGIVELDEFDSTLYFLDEAEIIQVADALREEYGRDVRQAALYALFDLFETQSDPAVRDEILGVLDTLFPNLLNRGEFRTVALIMREVRLIVARASDVPEAQRRRLQELVEQLSRPAIVAQLVQSLDEGGAGPGDEDVTEVLRELRPTALAPLIAAIPRMANAKLRSLIERTVDRLATQHPGEVLQLLRAPVGDALPSLVALCGRLALQQAVPGLGETLAHADPAVRLAAVQALAEIGTPGALTHIDRAIEDGDRGVRLAAVRALGARGYKNALRRVEAAVLGKSVREMDLTEKMAFFEAYGAIAGSAALATLAAILLPRGLLRRREPAEVRACAAMALGKIRTPEARDVLVRAQEDKELVVRNAVSRALREATA